MKEIIYTEKNSKPVGPYSQAVLHNGVCYTSGQLPIDPQSGELELVDVIKATRLCLDAIVNLSNEIGSNITDVIKCTIYLRDINDYKTVNEVYAEYFTENPPARTAFEVANLPFDVPVEIEAMISSNK